jgi:hypothetical protein
MKGLLKMPKASDVYRKAIFIEMFDPEGVVSFSSQTNLQIKNTLLMPLVSHVFRKTIYQNTFDPERVVYFFSRTNSINIPFLRDVKIK